MPRGGQKSYIQEMKERPKQTKPGDPLQWKDIPKKAKLPSERKGYNV